MTTIDETLFDEVGLSQLTAAEKTRILEYVNQTLFTNVGLQLANSLSETQLEAFNSLVGGGQDPSDWLEANVDDYESIIQTELATIKAYFKENAQNILNADQ